MTTHQCAFSCFTAIAGIVTLAAGAATKNAEATIAGASILGLACLNTLRMLCCTHTRRPIQAQLQPQATA